MTNTVAATSVQVNCPSRVARKIPLICTAVAVTVLSMDEKNWPQHEALGPTSPAADEHTHAPLPRNFVAVDGKVVRWSGATGGPCRHRYEVRAPGRPGSLFPGRLLWIIGRDEAEAEWSATQN